MESRHYTPQEAAAVAELSLAAVQKAITGKQVPFRRVGKPPRRTIDETSLLALALAQRLPRGVGLTVGEARRLLITNGTLRAEDVKGHLAFGGTVRVDLVETLGPVLKRLDLLWRARDLIAPDPDAKSGVPVIKGTRIQPQTLRDRLGSGKPLNAIQAEFPLLDNATIEAAALWADANPRRGRPKITIAGEVLTVPAIRDVNVWSRTMRITASQIDGWAHGEIARSTLPILVRRLINSVGSITQIAFPAGDSTNLPDWDGELLSEHGTPWVPQGRSFWELSCEAGVTSKANRDYSLRTKNTAQDVRRKSTFVAVTARRWPQKKKWLNGKLDLKEWADVRAYDADDLEQALEGNPSVALWFADELGLAGDGVESPVRYWENWSKQSVPAITKEAIFAARESTPDALIAAVRKRIDADISGPLVVKADSVGEAIAFVCAAIAAQADLSGSTLVITETAGWRFVEQNPVLKAAIAARTEIAEHPVRRKGLVVIIPFATGDLPSQFRGAAAYQDDTAIELYRPKTHEFEEALAALGIDKSDAKRLAVSTGRSWSVLRRHRSTNPALRYPAWLDCQQSRSLSTLCLLGSWSGANERDREIVRRIAGRPYEEIERDLRDLADMDDSPVLAIGEVWKAKSSLELLDLYGSRIPSDEVGRFLDVAREVLTAEDPQLELDDDKRFAAAIYGKVRLESGLLRDALCDTLVKLAVRGPEIRSMAALHIETRIGNFVHDLLSNADRTRWLSLASYLPHLAEAAPNQFLGAIEKSLSQPDPPVATLIAETGAAAITGRCWHSGLLWGLERLAWAPNRVGRVSLLLARLAHIPIKGNWANTPVASLHGIFRPWLPQTAATLDQRNAALAALIGKESDIAFALMERMINVGHDVAFPAARPDWREDDAGAGNGVTKREHCDALIGAADRLLRCAEGNAAKTARAVDRIDQLREIDNIDRPHPARVERVLQLAERFTDETASDRDRESIRAELRERIHWHRNYGGKGKTEIAIVDSMEALYSRLAPRDVVLRHKWLFAKNWVNPPKRVREDGYSARVGTVEKLRRDALQEITADRGLGGISELAASCPGSVEIGVSLASLGIYLTKLAHWIVESAGDLTRNDPIRAPLHGLLTAMDAPKSMDLIQAILAEGRAKHWSKDQVVNCLASARDERDTWNVVASLGDEIEKTYWETNTPGFWLRNEAVDFEFALRKLVSAGRPRTALNVCHMDFIKVEPELLAEMLERMLRGEETNGNVLHSWDIANAIKRLEIPGAISEDRLIQIEFGLIPALGYDGEHKASVLYRALMSRPELFVECLRLVYRSEKTEPPKETTEDEKTAANIAWQVLHHCKRLPGLVNKSGTPTKTGPLEPQHDADDDATAEVSLATGTIDRAEFNKFIESARKLAEAEGRLKVCDITLGEILAHAPADADGTWPCASVRDFLDRPDMDEMREGFSTGTFNKRGAHVRSVDEGGTQEREIAKTYRGHARAIQESHPILAAKLEQIAGYYDHDALREDCDARLRLEGH